MDKPTTHRWLPVYLLLLGVRIVRGVWEFFSLASAGLGGVAFIVVAFSAVEATVLYGLMTRKTWGWHLNMAYLAILPFIFALSFYGNKLATGDDVGLLGMGVSFLTFGLLYAFPNVIYFRKRKYFFDNGEGGRKYLLEFSGRRWRVLEFGPLVQNNNKLEGVDERFYELAKNEFDKNSGRESLVLKAEAESDGDTEKARLLYVEMRAYELAREASSESSTPIKNPNAESYGNEHHFLWWFALASILVSLIGILLLNRAGSGESEYGYDAEPGESTEMSSYQTSSDDETMLDSPVATTTSSSVDWESKYWDEVEQYFPGARTLNETDEGWHSFLEEFDHTSGKKNRDIGVNAIDNYDVQKMVTLFRRFKDENSNDAKWNVEYKKIILPDGTVLILDIINELVWPDAPHSISGNARKMSLHDATVWCANLKYGGCVTWRLPTLDQLKRIRKNKFLFSENYEGKYWTKSAFAHPGNPFAVWYIDMSSATQNGSGRYMKYFIWPVSKNYIDE